MGSTSDHLPKDSVSGNRHSVVVIVVVFRLGVFENRILRRIFVSKRGVNGEWRRLHNEELHGLCRSSNVVRITKSRRLRWAGDVVRMEEGRSALKLLTGKRPLRRPRRIWDDNIRMDLKKIGILYEELC